MLAFLRRSRDEPILVVANLSRFAQYVELDLSSHKGKVPVELFGKTEFPPIGDAPYFLTLGPHGFYWFSLESPDRETETATIPAETQAPILQVKGGPDSLFRKDLRGTLEKILPAYLRSRRWFGGKARRMKWARVLEAIPLANGASHLHLLLVQAEYTEGDPELYSLPVAFASGPEAERMLAEAPGAVIARVAEASRQHVLFDALQDKGSCLFLLDTIGHRRRFRGQAGEILGVPARAFRKIRGESKEAPTPVAGQGGAEQQFGDLRGQDDPEDLPARRSGDQPGPGDRGLPDGRGGLPPCPPGRRLPPVREGARGTDDPRGPDGVRPEPGRRVAIHPGQPRALLRAGHGAVRGHPRKCRGRDPARSG